MKKKLKERDDHLRFERTEVEIERAMVVKGSKKWWRVE